MVISETNVRPMDGAVEHPRMGYCVSSSKYHGSPIIQRFQSQLNYLAGSALQTSDSL
jgi:hypothetical protein